MLITVDKPTMTFALESLLLASFPCGGVPSLNIPPCGSEATMFLDRRAMAHCSDDFSIGDFKCQSCYDKWLNTVADALTRAGILICRSCDYVAHSIAGFAPYAPL